MKKTEIIILAIMVMIVIALLSPLRSNDAGIKNSYISGFTSASILIAIILFLKKRAEGEESGIRKFGEK